MSKEYPCVHYEKEMCKKFSEPGFVSWCVLGPCSHETPSNADRIRAMSDDDMAKWLADMFDCNDCSEHERLGDNPLLSDEQCDQECEKHCLEWLKQPYEDGDG